jgi:hypothetical protein
VWVYRNFRLSRSFAVLEFNPDLEIGALEWGGDNRRLYTTYKYDLHVERRHMTQVGLLELDSETGWIREIPVNLSEKKEPLLILKPTLAPDGKTMYLLATRARNGDQPPPSPIIYSIDLNSRNRNLKQLTLRFQP